MADTDKVPDQLKHLFDTQRAFQERLGFTQAISKEWNDTKPDYIRTMVLATTDELHEALREVPWKPWSSKTLVNQDFFKDELVDAWHFMINLTLASGMDADELHMRFIVKSRLNNARQDEGY